MTFASQPSNPAPERCSSRLPAIMTRFLREPLLHFLLLGAALFLWYAWSDGGSGPGSNRIVLTAGQIV